MTLGKNASREPNATCCERPMQSSARNCFAARLSEASHSRGLRRCGPDGTCPTSASLAGSAAVDKLEAARLHLRVTLAPTPGEEAHRRAEPAGEHEPGCRTSGGERGKLRAELRGHVGSLT